MNKKKQIIFLTFGYILFMILAIIIFGDTFDSTSAPNSYEYMEVNSWQSPGN